MTDKGKDKKPKPSTSIRPAPSQYDIGRIPGSQGVTPKRKTDRDKRR